MYWTKVALTLNRPIYVGFAILDLSKTLIYDFHCNYIKRKYPNSTLLFTDTDFLKYHIQAENVYWDFYADKYLLIFSGYEIESLFYNDENKNVIGKMKDELNGEIIEGIFSLRTKIYSLKSKGKKWRREWRRT